MDDIRPKILCSKCLGFDNCRYNGDRIPAPYVQKLGKFCDIVTVCPEVQIGLGVPRDPIRIVKDGSRLHLVQSETGLNITDDMEKFCESFLNSLGDIQGFILKYKSPSCGIYATKYYSGADAKAPAGHGPGLFGKAVAEKFPGYPAETETRLTNFAIREHFLLTLFTLARFAAVKSERDARALVEFQAKHKLLLLAYDQAAKNKMGEIVAHQKDIGLPEALEQYETLLLKAFRKSASHNAHVNVVQHAMGYFSKKITGKERDYMNNLIIDYRAQKVPLSALRALVNSYIIRFDIDYLLDQTYFDPYPKELVEVTDSGKGRDLKHI